jgi:hypothetical protein
VEKLVVGAQQFELSLQEASLQLLRDVVARRDPKLLPLLEPGALLVRSDVTALTDVISGEFIITGLGESYEPTEYGLKLEALLDAVNRHGFV